MIDVCISYGFGEENKYYQRAVPDKIQLATYKYEKFVENKDIVQKVVKKGYTDIKVIHLPLDTLRREKKEIFDLMEFGSRELCCEKFVIHPNKNIMQFIPYFLNVSYSNWKLCIETFGWKKKKELRGPLEIIEVCYSHYPKLSMVIDTSHISEVWFNHRIMPMLLKYTDTIHLSNRAKGVGSHLPFNSESGELNLVGFVRDLKYRYHWSGDLVLEYMAEYKDKLQKNKEYIERLLE